MPDGAEALRAERRAAREAVSNAAPAAMPGAPAPGGPVQGRALIRSAFSGTAVFAVATALAVAVPATRILAAVVDLLLFVAGSGVYLWGWGVAAGRSRENEISLWNLILLEDVAPREVRIRLLGALGLQVIVAAATCWLATALAFGWLVPVWGLAHCELWGARYGVFLSRVTEGKADPKTKTEPKTERKSDRMPPRHRR
jgi:hypothetical protein